MNGSKKRAVYSWLTYTLDIVLLGAVMLLQYFSHKKMGMMRYLVFKKRSWGEGWFRPELIGIYRAALILGIILFTVFLIYRLVRKSRGLYVDLLACMLTNGAGLFLLSSAYGRSLLAQYYFVVAIIAAVLLQYMKLLLFRGR